MSSHTIPAREMIICDVCGRAGERYAEGPFHDGGVHLSGETWGRSCDGSVGGAEMHLDMCLDCDRAFIAWKSARRKVVLAEDRRES